MWAKWHFRDFFTACESLGLTAEQEAVYHRLLGWQFETGHQIPDNPQRLSRIVNLGLSRDELESAWKAIQGKFPDGYNARVMETREEAARRSGKAAKAGKASGKARRRNASSNSSSNASSEHGSTRVGTDKIRQDKIRSDKTREPEHARDPEQQSQTVAERIIQEVEGPSYGLPFPKSATADLRDWLTMRLAAGEPVDSEAWIRQKTKQLIRASHRSTERVALTIEAAAEGDWKNFHDPSTKPDGSPKPSAGVVYDFD